MFGVVQMKGRGRYCLPRALRCCGCDLGADLSLVSVASRDGPGGDGVRSGGCAPSCAVGGTALGDGGVDRAAGTGDRLSRTVDTSPLSDHVWAKGAGTVGGLCHS